MQPSVQYNLKHSGDFLYKYSNEEDLRTFKITKIRLPHELKVDRERLEQSPVRNPDKDLPVRVDT